MPPACGAVDAFHSCFEAGFRSTIPAIAAVLDACHELVEAGYDPVCVTMMEMQFEAARLRKLRSQGFPIGRVIATSSPQPGESPKVAVLRELQQVAFVDDYLP